MTRWTQSCSEGLQALGRALMLPIAVLPVAALLLRLGQPDLFHLDFVSAAGNAVFAHLGLLFAIGVATGFARDGNGAAPLAGVVCFLIASEGAKALLQVPPAVTLGIPASALDAVSAGWRDAQLARLGVPIGIIAGVVGGTGYNRFSTVQPPEYLAFFGGKRFVPIVAGGVGIVLACLIGASHAAIDSVVDAGSRLALASGGYGLFVYGAVNRLLLVTGLHHIINNIAWFVVGDYHGTAGDLRRFFAGDPSAGGFMSGFFPVMMFGLPAACLAMYRSALPEQRRETGGMLLSLAATSFLTGITEPIEFSFMFLAPLLFVLHALLTGVAMALMAALNVHLGFGFSAGLFDYVLNYGKATRPLLLIPIGIAYFGIYYAMFRGAIVWLDLKTPGRDVQAAPAATVAAQARGQAFLDALGGTANVTQLGACTTRLRLIVADQARVDDAALRALGARGIIRPSPQALQVVLGPSADSTAQAIRIAMVQMPTAQTAPPPADDRPVDLDPTQLPPPFRAALGVVTRLRANPSRLIVRCAVAPDLAAMAALGLRGSLTVGQEWHLLFAPDVIAGLVRSAKA